MVELKLQEAGFQLIEASPKISKKAKNETKGGSLSKDAFFESSMETHGPKQPSNDAKANQRSLQILIVATVVLIAIALWASAR